MSFGGPESVAIGLHADDGKRRRSVCRVRPAATGPPPRRPSNPTEMPAVAVHASTGQRGRRLHRVRLGLHDPVVRNRRRLYRVNSPPPRPRRAERRAVRRYPDHHPVIGREGFCCWCRSWLYALGLLVSDGRLAGSLTLVRLVGWPWFLSLRCISRDSIASYSVGFCFACLGLSEIVIEPNAKSPTTSGAGTQEIPSRSSPGGTTIESANRTNVSIVPSSDVSRSPSAAVAHLGPAAWPEQWP
jgi:hypothetical protein